MALDHNLYNNWDEVQQHLGEGGGGFTPTTDQLAADELIKFAGIVVKV